MDLVNAPTEDITNMGQRMLDGNTSQVNDYKTKVDELFATVDKLEQRMNEVEQFYLKLKEPNTSKSASIVKDKEKEKHIPSMKKLQQDASRREAAAAKRMQELIELVWNYISSVLSPENIDEIRDLWVKYVLEFEQDDANEYGFKNGNASKERRARTKRRPK